MALDKQVVGVTFTQGLDTQSDKRIVLPGKMVALQNATMSEADTFKRRNGNTIISTCTALSTVATFADQLVALDGASLGSYSAAGQVMEPSGAVDNVSLVSQAIVRGVGINDSYDCATSGGYTCYVWRHFPAGTITSAATVTIRDETTGALVLAETGMRTSGGMRCPRVVAITGAFVILYFDGGTGVLYGRVVQLSAPATLGAETNLRTDISFNATTIDACAVGANVFVYYATSDATASTRAITLATSGTTPSVVAGPVTVTTQAQIADGKIAGLAISAYSATLLGAYVVAKTTAGTPGLWAAVVTSANTISQAAALKDATAAALSKANITAVLNGSTMSVYSDDVAREGEATATARLIRRIGLDSTNTIISAAITWANSMTRPNGTNGPFIVGKAFAVAGKIYVPANIIETGSGTLQNAWFLLLDTGTSFRVVARALYGTWGPPAAGVPDVGIPAALTLSASRVAVVAGRRTFASFDGGVNVSSTGMARLVIDFNTATPIVHAAIGSNMALANPMLSMYDGQVATEAAFNLFPEVVSAASGGGGQVDEGVHGIVALYEWFDAAGQRHQSAPSVAIQFTVPGGGGALAVNVTIPALYLTQKPEVTLAVYATKAGGTIYYRASTLNSPISNSTTASTIVFSYNVADATLSAGELLYTTGGILPNNAPPPCSALAVHQDRIFINVSDDPFAFQFSQPWVNGFGVQWNENLRGRVESTGGALTGFASMDDKLIIFRPRRIGVLFGNGPSTTGAQNGYNLVDLPVDVGCSEPRSILVMPEGVIFKSTSKGWYVLGRDLQLRWIGAGVQAYDGQGVTSAVLMDTLRECRFTTNDASGQTLIYAYGQKDERGVGQWSTYSNFTGVDAVWWPGGNAYVRATPTGIFKELPATAAGLAYGDNATTANGVSPTASPVPQTGSVIPMVFQTGWLKPGEALQAFQRIWRVLFTGAAAGMPPPTTTARSQSLAGTNTLIVVSTANFPASGGADTLRVDYGNLAGFYQSFTSYTVQDATTFLVVPNLTSDLDTGVLVTGVPAVGAAGSLQVDFYFDGNDATAFQTVTISDVSELVSGNAWNVRLQPNLQKCDAIMLKVTSTPAAQDPGASLNFSGMTMELGLKKGARKFNAAQTK